MRFRFPISTHCRNITVLENTHTFIFQIPLYYTEMDSHPILPSIKIKDNTCYITLLKPIKVDLNDNKENKIH